MSYSDIALLSADSDFILRVTACASTESIDDPRQWAMDHQWDMAAMPGFGDAYGYAVRTGINRPGNDESVISDGMILSAVQSIETGTPMEDDQGSTVPPSP